MLQAQKMMKASVCVSETDPFVLLAIPTFCANHRQTPSRSHAGIRARGQGGSGMDREDTATPRRAQVLRRQANLRECRDEAVARIQGAVRIWRLFFVPLFD